MQYKITAVTQCTHLYSE